MNRKFLFALIVGLALASVSHARTKLRDALDYDGYDKAEIAVFRLSNSTWSINKSGGSTTFQQFGVSHFDVPVPGDYDGDGKGDIAVWRNTDRVWYRINSLNSTFVAQQFGLIGDEPVQRDYDGDGK